tara:strand:+ start:770 stop:1105 length:336 start_codon:yes stop_codon:yes gene_type:complete
MAENKKESQSISLPLSERETNTIHSEVNNYGEVVACDFCNYGEETYGGVIIGSYAICGDCCNKNNYDKPNYEYSDEVDVIFDKEKTFRDNVLDYRYKQTGSRDAIQIITSF